MIIFRLLLPILLLFGIKPIAAATNSSSPVTWDEYSLSINGERLFVFSGEFHYMRLPVPELWLDIFQKLRAHGFNAISGRSFYLKHELPLEIDC